MRRETANINKPSARFINFISTSVFFVLQRAKLRNVQMQQTMEKASQMKQQSMLVELHFNFLNLFRPSNDTGRTIRAVKKIVETASYQRADMISFWVGCL